MIDHRIISASAGSGKTFALSSRYLSLLSQKVSPPTILATTFTRKAAGEILDRILLRLAQGAQNPTAAKKLAGELDTANLSLADQQAMLAALTRSMHQLSIGTMDRFFNRIAQSFRHELGIAASPLLVDASDPIVQQIRRQAIEAILADEVPQVLVTLLRQVHHDLAVQSVTKSLESLFQELHEVYLQAPDAAAWQGVGASPTKQPEEVVVQLIDRLAELQHHLPKTKTNGEVNKSFHKAWDATLRLAHRRDWPGFLTHGLVQKIAIQEHQYNRQIIEPIWTETYCPLIDHAIACVAQTINQRQQAAHELLKRFDRHDRRLREQAGVMLFSDLTTLLADRLPLTDPTTLTDIYYRLDSSVQHLMLDEFQDTALKQWQVIGPIAQEITSHGQASESGRSFFCVGDPKQSIYGWRGGCPELLDTLAGELSLPESAVTTMSRSWRSSPIVLNAVNEVFEHLDQSDVFDDQDRLALARGFKDSYQKHLAMKPLPGYVCLMTSPKPQADPPREITGDDRRLAHELFVAQTIAHLSKQAPGRSIGVLVKRNDTIRRLIYRFRRLGLSASGEGGSLLMDDPAVEAILSLIGLSDHPGDRVAEYHVAHAPSPLRDFVAEAPKRIESLRELRRKLNRQGYASVIADWASRLNPTCDARSQRRLAQLVELADRYDGRRGLRPSDFVRFVESSPVEEPMPATIRVMTVHKAKGLEFDAVVLPSLHEPFKSSSRYYLDRPGETQPVQRVFLSLDKETRSLFPQVQQACAQQNRRQWRDELGALYVAMTRARHGLYMIVPPRKFTRQGTLGLHPGERYDCPASLLRDTLSLENEETDQGEQRLYEAGDPDWTKHPSLPKPSGESPNVSPAPPKLAPWPVNPLASLRWSRQVTPSSLENQGLVRTADLLNLTPHQGREHGRLMHLWLSHISWLDESIRSSLNDRASWLTIARQEIGSLSDQEIGDKFSLFAQMLERPNLKSLLTRPALAPPVTLWRERAFAVRYQGKLIAGTFDRVVIEYRNGQPISAALIDFKTDRLQASDESAISQAIELYRPQLQAYRQALMGMLGLSAQAIEMKLHWLSIDRTSELP